MCSCKITLKFCKFILGTRRKLYKKYGNNLISGETAHNAIHLSRLVDGNKERISTDTNTQLLYLFT